MRTLKPRSDTLMQTAKITGEWQRSWAGFLTQMWTGFLAQVCPSFRYLLEM
jgi:hypothetical protein